jgi:hypothetical protein
MALTEAQEKELLENTAALKEQIAALLPLAQKSKDLEAQLVSLKDMSSQEKAVLALKTKYPDVPEATLLAIPADKREEHAKTLQDQFASLKAKSVTPAKNPQDAWAVAGSIGPTDEAGIQAEKLAKAKTLEEARSRGDVHGMLKTKSAQIVGWLRQTVPAPSLQ